VDYYAITSGPGSFTGLRVGMAAIQGLALPAARRVVPVPTLEALAESVLAQGAAGGVLVPCMDGQRGEVFLAAYVVASGTEASGGILQILGPQAGPPADVAALVREAAGDRTIHFVGDPRARFADALQAALPGVSFIEPTTTLAEATVRLAAARLDSAVAPHALRPLYVRRPDAFLARDRAKQAPLTQPTGDQRLVVRPAEPADFEAVAELQRATFTNAWGVDAIRWELEHTDVARLYVMHADGGLVGYCACWIVFDELHINSLAVAPSTRRQGHARQLLRQVFADAIAAGARSATLEVRESNVAARRLYEGLRFQVEGVRRNYYQGPREDALVLWHRDLRADFGA